MSIRPSSISQSDFDTLAEEKSKLYMDSQLNFIEKEKNILYALTEMTQS